MRISFDRKTGMCLLANNCVNAANFDEVDANVEGGFLDFIVTYVLNKWFWIIDSILIHNIKAFRLFIMMFLQVNFYDETSKHNVEFFKATPQVGHYQIIWLKIGWVCHYQPSWFKIVWFGHFQANWFKMIFFFHYVPVRFLNYQDF